MRVGIIGAGITGLTTAAILRDSGVDVTLFESGNRPGGVVHTGSTSDICFEEGPSTLSRVRGPVYDLFERFGLLEKLIESSDAARHRYLFLDGRINPVPLNPLQLMSSPVLSMRGKIRLLAEPFIGPAKSAHTQESVAAAITRRLGRETLDRIVEPVLGGIFAGDPAQLSFREAFPFLYNIEKTYGSFTMGGLRSIRRLNLGQKKKLREPVTFKGGLSTLGNTLAGRLGHSLLMGRVVSSIQQTPKGWRVHCSDSSDVSPEFDFIIITVPAPAAQRLAINERAPSFLSRIDYPPVAVASAIFRASDVNHWPRGFGVLAPKGALDSLLGVLFPWQTFPSERIDGLELATLFLGGSRNRNIASMSNDKLIAVALRDLEHMLGPSGTPQHVNVTLWPHAIPQYGLEHSEILHQLNLFERESPGIIFAGSYRGGVALSDRMRQAIEIAERICTIKPGAISSEN